MECNVCQSELTEVDKYYTFLVNDDVASIYCQARMCSRCLMRAVRGGSGCIVTEKQVVKQPALCFPLRKDTPDIYPTIAREEGWLVAPAESLETEDEEILHVAGHYDRALSNTYFTPSGIWRSAPDISAEQCFRLSCRNIRHYYAIWGL